MKVVTEKLVQRFIQVEDLSKGKHLQATLVASAEYEDNFGTVEIEISKKLKPYLLSLKGGQITYTNLACTLALKSSYSIRIYDLLAQYRVAGKRIIEVVILKEMLGIDKVKSYDRFNNFDQRVLQPAYKEINEKTDILFEYEKIKRGRTIIAIKFIIKTKKADTAVNKHAKLSSPKSNSSEVEKLNFYGVSKAKARELAKADISKVREALESIKIQSSEIKKPAG